jgi:hypothetical protein
MDTFGGNRAARVPLGQLLSVNDEDVGVMLTPATQRLDTDGMPTSVTNLSSWYIRPDHRWHAPRMMLSVLRNSNGLITDLSASEPVQKILLVLGFQPINDGETIIVLPHAALRRSSRAQVEVLSEEDAINDDTCTRLLAHQGFGCIAASLKVDGVSLPLLFKQRKIRGVPAAQLVFCGRNSAVFEHLDAIARFLIRQGQFLLIMDIPLSEQAPGINRPQRGRKFAKGHVAQNTTDYLGSELCLFDF